MRFNTNPKQLIGFINSKLSQQLNWLEDELKEPCCTLAERGKDREELCALYSIINECKLLYLPAKTIGCVFYLHSFKSSEWLANQHPFFTHRVSVFSTNVFFCSLHAFDICLFERLLLFFMWCVCNIRSEDCEIKKGHHHIFIMLCHCLRSVDTKSHILHDGVRCEMFINVNTIAVFVTFVVVDTVVIVFVVDVV